MESRNIQSDLLAFIFEKPTITEKIRVCEKIQNDVKKKEDSDSAQTKKIFLWAGRKKRSP